MLDSKKKQQSLEQEEKADLKANVYSLTQSLSLMPQGTLSPFVHRFETPKNKYIFDVNTGRILVTDQVIWEIINDFGILTKNNIIQKYLCCYKTPTICQAYDKIAYMQKHNKLLLPSHPTQIILPNKKNIKEILEQKCRCVILHVTENCNFRCHYCVYRDSSVINHKHSKHKMNWETAKLAIDDFINHSNYYSNNPQDPGCVSFYGGEPLLNFQLIKRCVAYVRQKTKRNIVFSITTNGSLLFGKVAEFLASNGFIITISLDGPAHIHDRCRINKTGKGTWECIIKNLKDFLDRYKDYKINGKLHFNAVLSSYRNILEVEEFFSSSELSPYAGRITVTPVSSVYSKCVNSISPENTDISDLDIAHEKFLCNLIEGKIKEIPHNKMWCAQQSLFERPYRSFHKRKIAIAGETLSRSVGPHGACIPGVTRIHVSTDGYYYPCESFPFAKIFRIGNVWEGKNFTKVHKMIIQFYRFNSNQCSSCWCSMSCDVGCYVDIIENARYSEKAKQKLCERYRKMMHSVLTNYCKILERNNHAFDYLNT